MIKKRGFNLIELLVVMLLILMVLAIATNFFVVIMRQSPKELKRTETDIEGLIALETLRISIENAGFGLPYIFQNDISYNEAAPEPCTGVLTNDSPSNKPRAIFSCNDLGFNGSDRLIIKGSNVAINNTSQKWTYVEPAGIHTWPNASDNLVANDKVIAIRPIASENTFRMLIMNGANFYTQFVNISSFPIKIGDVIYGVDFDSDLRCPFNRADYYIERNANTPTICQAGTGTLYLGTLNHGNGNFTFHPLLDCFADFQIIFFLDTDGNGTIDAQSEDITGFSAQNIREQVKEVRVFLLFQEGQIDRNYRYPFDTINVGNRTFNFQSDLSDATDWRNYRWNVYALSVKLKNIQ